MVITAKDLTDYFRQVVEVMENEKDYLCELDRKLGDGDHGVTMSIGWQAVNELLNNKIVDETDCGVISSKVGMTFLNAVGSSVGPLYATGFMRAGKAVKNKVELNDTDLAEYWIAFVNGVKERGNVQVGDKTIVDTLEPAVKALEENFEKSRDFISAFSEAVSAGEKGMKSTIDLVSKIGRSSRLGERSKGAQDPGATSAYLILSTFLEFAKAKS